MEESKQPPANVFWADKIAQQIIERAEREKVPIVCKSGASPSGAKHIGNLFDIMKTFFPYKAVKRKGQEARFVFTNDDRDPMRTIPDRLPDLGGVMQSTADFKEEWSKYLGMPYHNVPDPFGCCDSWSIHFNKVWVSGVFATGIRENEMEVFSNGIMYEEGKFDPYIEMALKDLDKTRRVFAPFQETMPSDYIPFYAICENCGKIIAKAIDVDLENKTVKYECAGRELAGKYKIEGCGLVADTSWHNGKLSWRFEWPAQWGIFGVLYEPFGKEHAEGSWQSGQVIAREIYGFEPPVSHIYEFLLIDGKKMAARIGNVYITQEMLDILEPEVFSFFYTKRSGKQRNFDIQNIHLLVNDFERAERVHFGLEEEKNLTDKETLMRQYDSVVVELPKEPPLRIDYQFASVIGQLAPDLPTALKMLRQSGHIKEHQELSDEDRATIQKRLNVARNWARIFAKENVIEINDELPAEVKKSLTEQQKGAMAELAMMLGKDVGQDKLYNSFFTIAKENNLQPKDFFKTVYQILINKNSGPRLAPFIMALGKERIKKILEQV